MTFLPPAPASFQPYGSPLVAVGAIPVHLDNGVPAGVAMFDLGTEDSRHIIRIRARSHEFALTGEQVDQIRDHYRAMNERAARLLDLWSEFTTGAYSQNGHPDGCR